MPSENELARLGVQSHEGALFSSSESHSASSGSDKERSISIASVVEAEVSGQKLSVPATHLLQAASRLPEPSLDLEVSQVTPRPWHSDPEVYTSKSECPESRYKAQRYYKVIVFK